VGSLAVSVIRRKNDNGVFLKMIVLESLQYDAKLCVDFFNKPIVGPLVLPPFGIIEISHRKHGIVLVRLAHQGHDVRFIFLRFVIHP
jgi:hypothetical protein